MIRQLITSTLLATSIGIQNANTTSAYATQTSLGYNIQEDYDYVDGILNQAIYYKIEYWTDIYIGTNINVKTKSLQYINRDIAENTYIYRSYTIMQMTTTLTTTNWNTNIQLNQRYNELVDSNIFQYGCIENPSQTIMDFFNGTGQASMTYNERQAIWTEIDNDFELIDSMSTLGNNIFYDNTTNMNDLIVIYTVYDFDSTRITDDGAFMPSVSPLSEFKQTLFWEIPSSPGSQYEIVDIPGMMFTILGMPFAWISTAFNFTIFPGTPYAVNLSNILMAIIISLIVLYIVKKIIK